MDALSINHRVRIIGNWYDNELTQRKWEAQVVGKQYFNGANPYDVFIFSSLDQLLSVTGEMLKLHILKTKFLIKRGLQSQKCYCSTFLLKCKSIDSLSLCNKIRLNLHDEPWNFLIYISLTL